MHYSWVLTSIICRLFGGALGETQFEPNHLLQLEVQKFQSKCLDFRLVDLYGAKQSTRSNKRFLGAITVKDAEPPVNAITGEESQYPHAQAQKVSVSFKGSSSSSSSTSKSPSSSNKSKNSPKTKTPSTSRSAPRTTYFPDIDKIARNKKSKRRHEHLPDCDDFDFDCPEYLAIHGKAFSIEPSLALNAFTLLIICVLAGPRDIIAQL